VPAQIADAPDAGIGEGEQGQPVHEIGRAEVTAAFGLLGMHDARQHNIYIPLLEMLQRCVGTHLTEARGVGVAQPTPGQFPRQVNFQSRRRAVSGDVGEGFEIVADADEELSSLPDAGCRGDGRRERFGRRGGVSRLGFRELIFSGQQPRQIGTARHQQDNQKHNDG